jgi:uncharacterized protein involved in exopolysaccharide biosynthesis
MNENEKTKEDFTSLNILYFIYKWRKQLVIVGLSAAIISGIVALTIRNKYKSTVVLFPATTNSISKSLLNDNYVKEDVLQFGEEEQAEQMLQILNSDALRGRIIQKYNLMRHYEIDPSDKFARTKLSDEFESNVSFKRTEFMSVKIDVLDWNADTAALIANDIAALYDSTKLNIQRSRSMAALKIVEQEYFARLKEIQEITDSIKSINEKGLFGGDVSGGLLDDESQSEPIKQHAIRFNTSKSSEEKLNVMAKYGSTLMELQNKIKLFQKQLIIIKTKYEQSKVDAEQELPQKFIVSNAYPSEKKSYPVRWLIVVISTLSSLLLAIISILLIENIKQFKTK